ncbi:MAG: hypothetical protein EBT82_03435 [Micrococcales bacterium]|nr:hypothetical protein [Micrococcales bacterium]
MKITPLFLSTAGFAGLLLTVTWFLLRAAKKPLLWQRWNTWLAIALLFGFSYLVNGFTFRALVLIIGMIMLYEFCRLMDFYDSITAIVMLVVWQHFFEGFLGFSPASVDIAVLVVAALTALFVFRTKLWAGPVAFIGILLLGLVWPLLVLQPDKTLALLLTVACFDVAAFTGGTLLGKSGILSWKIFPKTSPNKTLAGLLTGIIAVALVLVILAKFSVMSLVLVIVGALLGDYLESRVKRFAEVKDAGSWLPGFGGLLDRFDSLILVAPLAVIIF